MFCSLILALSWLLLLTAIDSISCHWNIGISWIIIEHDFRIFSSKCEHFMRKPLLHSNYKRLISMFIVHPSFETEEEKWFSKLCKRFNHVYNKSMVIGNQLHKMPRIFRPKSIEHWMRANEHSDYMDWLSNKLTHLYSNRENVFMVEHHSNRS